MPSDQVVEEGRANQIHKKERGGREVRQEMQICVWRPENPLWVHGQKPNHPTASKVKE
jgi:hypothetical protein